MSEQTVVMICSDASCFLIKRYTEPSLIDDSVRSPVPASRSHSRLFKPPSDSIRHSLSSFAQIYTLYSCLPHKHCKNWPLTLFSVFFASSLFTPPPPPRHFQPPKYAVHCWYTILYEYNWPLATLWLTDAHSKSMPAFKHASLGRFLLLLLCFFFGGGGADRTVRSKSRVVVYFACLSGRSYLCRGERSKKCAW